MIFFLSVCAVAYPEVGHQFYGYAGSGGTVTVTYEDLTFTTAVDSDGYYGYDPLFFVDAASDDIEGAEDGDTLTFSLDGTEITTYTFSIGGITKLDFEDDPATSSVETAGSSSDAGTTAESAQTDTSGDKDDDDSRRSGRRKSSKTTTEKEAEDCSHKWTCTSWGSCAENGFQTRMCYYVGNCTQEGNQSDTRQRCTYIAPEEEPVIEEEEPTCYDNIQNQGERGRDCGGPCDACPTAPVVEEPKTNWLYIGLAIFLLLLIIAIILAHKYKEKLLPYWEKFKSKVGIKPKAAPAAPQTVQRPAQYPLYQQQYRPQYPVRK